MQCIQIFSQSLATMVRNNFNFQNLIKWGDRLYHLIKFYFYYISITSQQFFSPLFLLKKRNKLLYCLILTKIRLANNQTRRRGARHNSQEEDMLSPRPHSFLSGWIKNSTSYTPCLYRTKQIVIKKWRLFSFEKKEFSC